MDPPHSGSDDTVDSIPDDNVCGTRDLADCRTVGAVLAGLRICHCPALRTDPQTLPEDSDQTCRPCVQATALVSQRAQAGTR